MIVYVKAQRPRRRLSGFGSVVLVVVGGAMVVVVVVVVGGGVTAHAAAPCWTQARIKLFLHLVRQRRELQIFWDAVMADLHS
jgi:hypothetical protein